MVCDVVVTARPQARCLSRGGLTLPSIGMTGLPGPASWGTRPPQTRCRLGILDLGFISTISSRILQLYGT